MCAQCCISVSDCRAGGESEFERREFRQRKVVFHNIHQGTAVLHCAWASPGIFPEGGKLLGETQNSQGSPLGGVLRFAVGKISKGPPWLKFLGKTLDKNYHIFLTASGASPKFLEFLFKQVTHTLLRSVFRVLCFCYAKDCPG